MSKHSRIKYKNRQKGFIALISTLILTTALMMLLFASNTSSFFARFDSLGSEYKRISLGLSESCSNAALLKISQDYNYDVTADPDYDASYAGVVVEVGDDICIIKAVDPTNTPSPQCDPSPNQKCLRIKTAAQYPLENGSWSTNEIKIILQNPTYSPTNPPPTCSFISNTTSISEGQAVTFNWNIGGNADNFIIERDTPGTGVEEIYSYNAIPAISSITDDPAESATYTATVSGPGGESQCASPVSVEVQPALSCADTVMTLDRTGTIFDPNQDGNNSDSVAPAVKAAAKKLLDLYKAVVPAPKVGVVRFGDSTDGGVEAQVVPDGSDAGSDPDGWLSTNFGDDDGATDGDLFGAVELALSAQSSVQTNIADAFNVTKNELNSSRHDPTKSKVMILVSDGDPNEPPNNGVPSDQAREAALDAADSAKLSDIEVFTIHFGADPAGLRGRELLAALASGDESIPTHGGHGGGSHQNGSVYDGSTVPGNTGFQPPGTFAPDPLTDDGWLVPSGANNQGPGDANDNEGDRERYYNFGFSFPAGITPTGIEITADAWSSVSTGNISPSSNSADTGGDNNGFELTPTNAYADGGGTPARNIDGTGDRHRFWGYNFGLPVGSSVVGIEVRPDWYLDSTSGTSSVSIDLSWDGGTTWTNAKVENTETTSDSNGKLVGGAIDTWGRTWSLSDFSTSNFRVRIKSNSTISTRDFSLDWIPVRLHYVPSSNACQLGVSLSWNGQAGPTPAWTSGPTNPTKTATLTGSEATYTFGGQNDDWGHANWQTTELDNGSFRVRVHDVDPDVGSNTICKDNATTHLDYLLAKIHYTETGIGTENTDNDHFFISTSPTGADMPGIFDTIGKLACPASVPPPPPPAPGAPPPPPPPPPPIEIGSWDETIGILP